MTDDEKYQRDLEVEDDALDDVDVPLSMKLRRLKHDVLERLKRRDAE